MVELMVGIALGLFIVAGALTLFVNHLGNSRRLLLEARLNQDLRAAADLITRDLRRAGYWGNAVRGTVILTGAGSTTPNPYAAVTPTSSTIAYSFSRDGATDDDVLTAANETFTFRWQQVSGVGVIQMALGAGNWQTVTDSNTMNIPTANDFSISDTSGPAISIGDACAKPFTNIGSGAVEPCCDAARYAAGLCAGGQVVNWNQSCPTIKIRQYLVTINGQAARDATVTRTLQARVRVRNDLLAGTCPA